MPESYFLGNEQASFKTCVAVSLCDDPGDHLLLPRSCVTLPYVWAARWFTPDEWSVAKWWMPLLKVGDKKPRLVSWVPCDTASGMASCLVTRTFKQPVKSESHVVRDQASSNHTVSSEGNSEPSEVTSDGHTAGLQPLKKPWTRHTQVPTHRNTVK